MFEKNLGRFHKRNTFPQYITFANKRESVLRAITLETQYCYIVIWPLAISHHSILLNMFFPFENKTFEWKEMYIGAKINKK